MVNMTSNLDIEVSNHKIHVDSTNVSALLSAVFSDVAVDMRRGYWLPYLSSRVWVIAQSKLIPERDAELQLYITDVTQKLIEKGYFDRIDVTVTDSIATITVYKDQDVKREIGVDLCKLMQQTS